MTRSLFARVTRYQPGASDPRENRLTEATAATLEAVDGLPLTFAQQLLRGPAASSSRLPAFRELGPTDVSARLRTQVPAAGGYVDLEVRFDTPTSEHPLRLWVEVKHGSGLHDHQIETYLNAAEALPGNTAVVILAPRDSKDIHHAQVATRYWEDLSRRLRSETTIERPAEQRWLLAEYLKFLEEEGLMDPETLTAGHALAFQQEREAHAAATSVGEAAQLRVKSQWGGAREPNERQRPLARWYPFDPGLSGTADPHWGPHFFEWGFSSTADWMYWDEELPSGYAFYAGVSFGSVAAAITKADGAERWHSTMRAAGFKWVFFGGRYRYVRALWPEQVLAATDRESQAGVLEAHVLAAFRALAADPPPVLLT